MSETPHQAPPLDLADRGSLDVPQITLPKGGGAIRGIGEKFAANPVTGTASLTVPIHTSPGRSGFGPRLTLEYDSGAGKSPFGLGWNLSVPAVTRKTDKGLPRYDDADESDVFILSGAEDLVPVAVEQGGHWSREVLPPRTVEGVTYRIDRYRPRVEGLFAQIERWTVRSSGESHWRSITRDNVTTLYGKTNNSRIFDPDDPDPLHPVRIFSWLICESFDDKGNRMVLGYKDEDSVGIDESQGHEQNRDDRSRSANRYLKFVRYGNRVSRLAPPDPANGGWLFEVVLDYGEHDADDPKPGDNGAWVCRNDPFSSYRSSFEIRTYRLCQRVLMFHHFPAEPGIGTDCLVRSTDFTYRSTRGVAADDQRGHPLVSFLASVSQQGYIRRAGGGYASERLPPLEFSYSDAVVHDDLHEVDRSSLENLPAGVDGAGYRWIDLDGEGVSGVLTDQADAWFFKPSLGGGRFGPLERVAERPPLATLSGGPQQLIDLAGDGQLDLVAFAGPAPGFSERTADRRWEPFKAFTDLPNIRWDDPNLRFLDLSGDGLADAVITDCEAIRWYPSLAESGFDSEHRVHTSHDEESGPRLLFADVLQSVYLADMTGDGLTDLVRIRNGEVCYWPNRGYGRFGAKVSMDDAPVFDSPEHFDYRRVRLADIDGSGSTDIIYLGSDSVRLYFNESGNRWAQVRRLAEFPAIDNAASVDAVDLLGNGTTCLVWSSALPGSARSPVRYVDLMGGRKPHLLAAFRNNFGAETRVHYAPSTKFYLADKEAGRPWVTRLPFPVHVVERVEILDRVSRNRFVTRSAYHHGHFDGIEREFRGFGLVEQWSTEEFALLSASDEFPDAENIDATSHVPPTLTKTWFHTGALFGGEAISRRFEAEYWRESDASRVLEGLSEQQLRSMLLPDTLLPQTVRASDGTRLPYALTAAETSEAARALNGSLLRQEVYGLDGSEAQDRPYSVTERSYTIELVQPRGTSANAVFFVHQREDVEFHYERALYEVDGKWLADPRVTHHMTLDVDRYGNVTRAAAIAYGRRRDDPRLPTSAVDRARQRRTTVTYTEDDFTNDLSGSDAYRAPMPYRSRTFELVNVSPGRTAPLITNLFEFAELAATIELAADGVHDLEYEDFDAAGATTSAPYRRPIEHVATLFREDDLSGPLGFGVVESRALPFESYKQAFTPGLARKLFVDSGRIAAARLDSTLDDCGYVHLGGDASWWIPTGRIFYAPATVAQEREYAFRHFFQPCRFRDPFHTAAASTEAHVTYDDHDLLITESRDPLDNVVASENNYRTLAAHVVTDANGNQSAVRANALGMVTMTFAIGKPGASEGDRFDGGSVEASALDDPTTSVEYALFAHMNDPAREQPAHVRTLARERHRVADTVWQESFSYSDGFEREIQVKLRAEPGPLVPGGPVLATRWVGSGWAVFNNRGKPVRRYEPFYDDSHDFSFGRQVGVSPVLFYDPADRVVATLHPNRTYEKVVFDPWFQASWDANDTALQLDPRDDPHAGDFFRRLPTVDFLPTWFDERNEGALGLAEQGAATRTMTHAGTPALSLLDPLGHVIGEIADCGLDTGNQPVLFTTRAKIDLEGNTVEVTDAKGRVSSSSMFDMLGTTVAQASIDAGARWTLPDVTGRTVLSWDSRGHEFRVEYDRLRRPIRHHVRGTDPVQSDPDTLAGELLFESFEYGEAQAQAATLNLRGRVRSHRDGAGILTNEAFDFKGNPLRVSRAVTGEYEHAPDWSTAVATDAALEHRWTYDALDRVTTMTTPDRTVTRYSYNETNQLRAIDANVRGEIRNGAPIWTPFIRHAEYNARGQRTLIEYGNGVRTRFTYDGLTFRLARLLTIRNATDFPDDCPDSPPTAWPGCQIQNLSYTYDPVGNITHVRDAAQQTIFFRNKRVEPSGEYTYDPLYRLVEATGREHLGQIGSDPTPTSYNDRPRIGGLLSAGDGQAVARYRERYAYDAVGNLEELTHRGTDPSHPGWTRLFHYEEPGGQTNRLTRTSGSAGAATFSVGGNGYDANGNMLAMPQLQDLQWDFMNRLKATRRQAVGADDADGIASQGERTWYVYDADGERVRKVSELAPGQIKDERLYLGGWEIYRRGGANAVVRETLHVMDDDQRVALVETRIDGPAPERFERYQLGNHLESVELELGERGALISYEEYSPYGSTTYQAVRSQTQAPRRYRFAGKERDEETGLSYFGARYYAPWLGRWVSCDPEIWDAPAESAYMAFANSPVTMSDPDGRKPLIANNYKDLAALKKAVDIKYTPAGTFTSAEVSVTDKAKKSKGTNTLSESNVGQAAIVKAARSTDWAEQGAFALSNPTAVYHKNALEGIEKLSFVAKNTPGTALGKISDAMYPHIAKSPTGPTYVVGGKTVAMSGTTKNMLLHVFGQAVITTIYGRSSADFAGDAHERDTPGLISGTIAPADERKAIDDYTDMVNNLYGQDIGERVGKKLGVSSSTVWTPALTAKYVNAVQAEIASEMGWKMTPFSAKDPEIVKFSALLNEVQGTTPAAAAPAVKSAAKPAPAAKKKSTPPAKKKTTPTAATKTKKSQK
jgi:RHS repeat-associated protein